MKNIDIHWKKIHADLYSRRDRRQLISWFAAGFATIMALAALNPWFWGLLALLIRYVDE